jgi:hypothetical protein
VEVVIDSSGDGTEAEGTFVVQNMLRGIIDDAESY